VSGGKFSPGRKKDVIVRKKGNTFTFSWAAVRFEKLGPKI
jgi:hypothetical protein